MISIARDGGNKPHPARAIVIYHSKSHYIKVVFGTASVSYSLQTCATRMVRYLSLRSSKGDDTIEQVASSFEQVQIVSTIRQQCHSIFIDIFNQALDTYFLIESFFPMCWDVIS